jgi:hypothetical protein
VTYRQADSWGRLGLWKPEFPAAGMGTKAVVSAADLEGVGLLGRLAPFLLGQHASKGPRMMPLWPDLRQACKLGGVWIAASDSLWVPWEPNCPVPTVGVIVDVDAVMVEVHDRIAKHGPGRLSSS